MGYRSTGSPVITFGMVNVPCKQYKTTDGHGIKFNQCHGGLGGCGGAVGYNRYCKECGKNVEFRDIVRGTDYDGKQVLLTDDEFDAVERELGQSIEVDKLVSESEIDPMLYSGDSYLLVPDEPAKGKKGGSKGAARAYELFRSGLVKRGRVAVAHFTSRGVQRPAVVRVQGNRLVLLPLLWADQIREQEFKVFDTAVELSDREIEVADMLLDSMVGEFVHSEYEDTYQAALADLVADKAAGGGIKTLDDDDEPVAEVGDLLSKLEASLRKQSEDAHPAGKARENKETA